MLQAMAGPDHRDPLTIDAPPDDYLAACDGDLTGLRVAWSGDLGYAAVDPEVRAIAERAAQRFTELGATVEEPTLELARPVRVAQDHLSGERRDAQPRARPRTARLDRADDDAHDAQRGPLQRDRAEQGDPPADGLLHTPCARPSTTYDLLLTPQMPVAAWSCEPGADEGTFDDRRSPRVEHLRPRAVHVPLQSDRPARRQPPVRLHEGRAYRSACRSSAAGTRTAWSCAPRPASRRCSPGQTSGRPWTRTALVETVAQVCGRPLGALNVDRFSTCPTFVAVK